MTVNVTLRNPLNKDDQITYYIDVHDTYLASLWYKALQELLQSNKYLEKNFCFLGFPDSDRNLKYICKELNWAKETINSYFKKEYEITETFDPDMMFHNLQTNHELMNKLHYHFELLQGTVNGLSDYYIKADYKTKFAIRQLNNLCHEAEALMLSIRKKHNMPLWIRPSQITTFLTAQRFKFPVEHKQRFNEKNYDRKFGEVYLHWSQIGKTLFEVFRDESGADLDISTCSAITHLEYYSGEFDIEWGNSIIYNGNFPWHNLEIDNFKNWLIKNNIDINDSTYNFGYHPIGQVDLIKSFGTKNQSEIVNILSKHLDIYCINAGGVTHFYNYNWTDENYYDEQIKLLIPGYDYSSRQILQGA